MRRLMANRPRSCSHDGFDEHFSPSPCARLRSWSFDRAGITDSLTRLHVRQEISSDPRPWSNTSAEGSDQGAESVDYDINELAHGSRATTKSPQTAAFNAAPCAAEDVSEKISQMEGMRPFRLMELPTEIRLEIYRACLTRPNKIILAKQEIAQTSMEFERSEFGPVGAEDVWPEVLGQSRTGTDTLPSMGSAGRPSLRRRSRTSQSISATIIPVSNRRGERISGQIPLDYANTQTARRRRINALSRRHELQERAMRVKPPPPVRRRQSSADPLLINLLRTCSSVYKEARAVLYSENVFVLELESAIETLACLHQRSRRLIRHVELEIPTFNEILDRFQETVRLSLRYCSGLKKFEVNMPFAIPGADGSNTTGNTSVYANGFDILRWLPQDCDVVVHGRACTEVDDVVSKHLTLAKTLNKLAYARRQLVANDTTRSDKL